MKMSRFEFLPPEFSTAERTNRLADSSESPKFINLSKNHIRKKIIKFSDLMQQVTYYTSSYFRKIHDMFLLEQKSTCNNIGIAKFDRRNFLLFFELYQNYYALFRATIAYVYEYANFEPAWSLPLGK